MLPFPEDWRCRHAMLMAISAVGEGCEKQVQPILGDVVQAVLPYCQDPVSVSKLTCIPNKKFEVNNF